MARIQENALLVWSGNKNFDQANQEYTEHMHQIEFIIMMHYAAGSPFKTDFWDYAQERGIKKIEDSKNDLGMQYLYRSIKDVKFMNMAREFPEIPEFGPWLPENFVRNISGLGISGLMNKTFL
jgi:hypothetical protein